MSSFAKQNTFRTFFRGTESSYAPEYMLRQWEERILTNQCTLRAGFSCEKVVEPVRMQMKCISKVRAMKQTHEFRSQKESNWRTETETEMKRCQTEAYWESSYMRAYWSTTKTKKAIYVKGTYNWGPNLHKENMKSQLTHLSPYAQTGVSASNSETGEDRKARTAATRRVASVKNRQTRHVFVSWRLTERKLKKVHSTEQKALLWRKPGMTKMCVFLHACFIACTNFLCS